MTNAKEEFTREEVEFAIGWVPDAEDGSAVLKQYEFQEIKAMLRQLAARLAEDEASKPVWVNSRDLEYVRHEAKRGMLRGSPVKTEDHNTLLYARSQPCQ